jgi:hypothetical protein
MWLILILFGANEEGGEVDIECVLRQREQRLRLAGPALPASLVEL